MKKLGVHAARLRVTFASLILLAALTHPVYAYRPFDGTDADVAAEGEFELELGPAHFLTRPEGHYLLSPATVLNLGVARGFELVVDFKNFVGLETIADQSGVRLLDTDIFIKAVLRRGTLQGETGVSVALEAGPLLPELGGASNFGAQANLITSYRWPSLALHLNTSGALSREQNFDGFSTLIVEGPSEWKVRPVGEVFVEHEVSVGTTYSALGGAILQVRDGLSFDAAARFAKQPGGNAFELRFGLTWALPVWGHKEEAEAEK